MQKTLPLVIPDSEVKKVDKIWGWEKWFWNESYCLKFLFIKNGHACSYHSHKVKDEIFNVLAGNAIVYISWDSDETKAEKRQISVGDTLHIPTGMWHRIVPDETDLLLIEVSTHHSDEDSYRISSGY